jgi:asparagine synthetase B (glutamine-hydrolysing)
MTYKKLYEKTSDADESAPVINISSGAISRSCRQARHPPATREPQFLKFGTPYEDNRTILHGVQKLPPGRLLRVRADEKPELERYFRPQLAGDKTPRREMPLDCVRRLRTTL